MNERPPIRTLSTFDGIDNAERELTIAKLIVEVHDWLAKADDDTPIWEFSSVRAYAADITSIVSRLNLSTELRLDSLLVQRLAERATGKAVRRGQAAGTIGSTGTNSKPDKLPSPQPYIGGGTVAHDIYRLTDGATDAQFAALLAEAKQEGRLSRAYVARKVEASLTGKRVDSRKPIVDEARDLGEALRKVTVRLKKLHDDDRLGRNKGEVAARLRYYVAEAETACSGLRETLDKE